MGQRGKVERENFRLWKAYFFGLRLGTFLNHVRRVDLVVVEGRPPPSSLFFLSLSLCVNLQCIKLRCWIGSLFANCARSMYVVMKITVKIHSLIYIVRFFDILTF